MLRIAMVEDSQADARMMQMALEQSGLPTEITVLTDGLKALEFLRATNPARGSPPCDVLILDLNLPRVSGYELLEQIRASDQLRSLPVIVMSGSSDPMDVIRCYRAGANSYIVKPTHLSEILAAAALLVGYWSQCARLPVKRPIALASMRSM